MEGLYVRQRFQLRVEHLQRIRSLERADKHRGCSCCGQIHRQIKLQPRRKRCLLVLQLRNLRHQVRVLPLQLQNLSARADRPGGLRNPLVHLCLGQRFPSLKGRQQTRLLRRVSLQYSKCVLCLIFVLEKHLLGLRHVRPCEDIILFFPD